MKIRRVSRRVPAGGSRKRTLPLIAILLVAAAVLSLLIPSVYLYYNSKRILEARLKTQKWALPSTIYADAPVLYEGMPQKIKSVLLYLDKLGYVRASDETELKSGQYIFSKDRLCMRKRRVHPAQNTYPVCLQFAGSRIKRIVNAANKEEVPAYEMEPVAISNLFGTEWEKRTLVRYEDLPEHLVQAVLAIEDRRFFSHGGVDLKAIVRAILHDLLNRSQLQGGSTVTQQLVKNFYLTPERSVRRKISEAMIAWLLEKRMTKQEIMEMYLNEIYLGQRGAMSINGVGEASRLLFRKDVTHISVTEAALIAGMIQAPNTYNPYKRPKEAKARRDTVLRAMREIGALTTEEFKQYAAAPLKVYPFDTRINLAPYFGDIVEAQLKDKYDADAIYTKNLQVYTTLDLNLQQYAEEALANGLEAIDKVRLARVKKHAEGCLIAIEPQTGYIRAFVGGRSYSRSQFDRISKASRQPGSVFKPVVFATALEQAFANDTRIFTPATLIDDAPWVLKYSNKSWEPKNYDGRYHGVVTLRVALAQSMNIATAKLAEQVGFRNVASLGKRLGFETVKAYPSIALGAFEVSPWQVASAYTVFANGGVKTELRTVKKVVDAEGKTLERSQIEVRQVIHPQTAYIITNMLQSVMTSGTAASVRRWGFVRPAAGKTGTTDEYRDAWFVGYTPNLLCVVWTGYDDNTPIKMNGAQAALPIWFQFMKKATENSDAEDFSSPQGVVMASIDPATGQLSTDSCPASTNELFIQGTEPIDSCSRHDSHWWDIYGNQAQPSARLNHGGAVD